MDGMVQLNVNVGLARSFGVRCLDTTLKYTLGIHIWHAYLSISGILVDTCVDVSAYA